MAGSRPAASRGHRTVGFADGVQHAQHLGVRGDIPLLGADVGEMDDPIASNHVEPRPLAERPQAALHVVLEEHVAVGVGKDREGELQLLHQRARLRQIVRGHADNLRAAVLELLVLLPQLREMPTAERSTAAPQEHQHHGLSAPVVGQTDLAAGRRREREVTGPGAWWDAGRCHGTSRGAVRQLLLPALLDCCHHQHTTTRWCCQQNVGMSNTTSLGGRLRELRTRKGITIPTLASLSGLSAGFVSQVETGKASVSLDSLARIADALGLCLADLFDMPGAEPRVVRADRRPMLREGSEPPLALLTPPFHAGLQVLLVDLEPGDLAGGCDHQHQGEEVAWVLAGQVRVTQGKHEVLLQAGDSALLGARLPHTYEVVGTEPARLLVAAAPAAPLPVSRA